MFFSSSSIQRNMYKQDTSFPHVWIIQNFNTVQLSTNNTYSIYTFTSSSHSSAAATFVFAKFSFISAGFRIIWQNARVTNVMRFVWMLMLVEIDTARWNKCENCCTTPSSLSWLSFVFRHLLHIFRPTHTLTHTCYLCWLKKFPSKLN